MPEILRITPRDKWEQAVAEGEFRSDDLATEGFIHCSTPEQLPGSSTGSSTRARRGWSSCGSTPRS